MTNLLLSILSATVIMVVFKIIDRKKIDILPSVAINYITAAALGFSINNTTTQQTPYITPTWIWLSVIIGILLIANFYIIGISTQKTGIATTTISVKMSFVIPVIFSLIFDKNDNIGTNKLILIVLAIISVLLVIYPNRKETTKKGHLLYPLLLFIGVGILDAIVKYSQFSHIKTVEDSSLFSAVNFTIAGIIGIIILLFNYKKILSLSRIDTWIAGIVLGIANFGSMYYLINALNTLKYDNSLVFGINNIGIVALTVAIAIIFYKERFSVINRVGLILSLVVLFFMVKIFM